MLRRLTKLWVISLALASFGVPVSACAAFVPHGKCCPMEHPAPCGECPAPNDHADSLCSPAAPPVASASQIPSDRFATVTLASGASAAAPPAAATAPAHPPAMQPPSGFGLPTFSARTASSTWLRTGRLRL